MAETYKNQKDILNKLKIDQLNPMQEEAKFAIHSNTDVVLLSPTGTGKTLAFLLPIIAELNPECTEVQTLIIVPSRELAIQIEQVTREMGTGYKANVVYGGQSFTKDKSDLQHPPAILIGTPGRVADHIRRNTFSIESINTLVLDEFDKSLEIGFEKEMKQILFSLTAVTRKILTSATFNVEVPDFVRLNNAKTINYLDEKIAQLEIKLVESKSKDKLDTLVALLSHIGNHPGIIFCNFKETIQRVSDFLTFHHIQHGCFYGGMEQHDRERALIKFRNGTHQLIIATDLAARGLDIPELKFIIHYHIPQREHEFTHRNGRTARMNSEGTAYILKWEQEKLPEYMAVPEKIEITEAPIPETSNWKTLFISGGRKNKFSKGDIAGFLFKQGGISNEQIGLIELKQDCTFVAVRSDIVDQLILKINNTTLKKKKVKVTLI